MKLRPTKKKKLNNNEIAVSDSDVNKSTNTHNESDEQPQVTEQPDASEGNEESQSIPVSADQQKLSSKTIEMADDNSESYSGGGDNITGEKGNQLEKDGSNDSSGDTEANGLSTAANTEDN